MNDVTSKNNGNSILLIKIGHKILILFWRYQRQSLELGTILGQKL
jgi:hypothetical protein